MMPLNPGIVRTVEWLNAHGFPTCDSGDGVTHDAECDREMAYVVVQLDCPDNMVSETARLLGLLVSEGVTVQPVGDKLPYIQADFDPVVGIAFIQLIGLADDDWCRETWSAEEIAQAKTKAKKLREDLGWGDPLDRDFTNLILGEGNAK